MQLLDHAATPTWTADNFQCTVCHQLLFNPVALNCGHAVCQATCVPWANSNTEPACPRCEATIIGKSAVCGQVYQAYALSNLVMHALLPVHHAIC